MNRAQTQPSTLWWSPEACVDKYFEAAPNTTAALLTGSKWGPALKPHRHKQASRVLLGVARNRRSLNEEEEEGKKRKFTYRYATWVGYQSYM